MADDNPYTHAMISLILGSEKKESSPVASQADAIKKVGSDNADLAARLSTTAKESNRGWFAYSIMFHQSSVEKAIACGASAVAKKMLADVSVMESGAALNAGLASMRSQDARANLASEAALGSLTESVQVMVASMRGGVGDYLPMLPWPTKKDLSDLYLFEIEGVQVPGVVRPDPGKVGTVSEWYNGAMKDADGQFTGLQDPPLLQIMKKNGTYDQFKDTPGYAEGVKFTEANMSDAHKTRINSSLKKAEVVEKVNKSVLGFFKRS